MLSMLAAFAVSAVVSSSASAALKKCTATEQGGDNTWCIETSAGVNQELSDLGGTEAFTSKGGASSITNAGITIECKKETDKGNLIQEDSVEPKNSGVSILFKECSVKNNPKCVVRNQPLNKIGELEVGPLTSGVVKIGTKWYDKFQSPGGTFITIEVLNKGTENCLIKNTYAVTGEACGELSTSETLTKVQTLTFSKAVEEACGTELKLKGVKSVFTDTKEVELSGVNAGKPWGLAES